MLPYGSQSRMGRRASPSAPRTVVRMASTTVAGACDNLDSIIRILGRCRILFLRSFGI